MTRPTRFLSTSLIAAALAWLAFALSRRAEDAPAPQRAPQRATPAPAAVAATTTAHPPSPSAVTTAETSPTPVRDEAPLRPPAIALDAGPLAWEQQLADATARGRDAAGKARELLALLPRLPEEALTATAQKAVEHLPDADYAATALPVVTNSQTPGQVLSVLFADLMERPDTITLPALLSIARNPAHPFSPAALDNLRLLLGANFGADWPKWKEAVQGALAPK